MKLDTLMHTSFFVSLMRRCTKVVSPGNVNTGSNEKYKGNDVTPARKSELESITKFLSLSYHSRQWVEK